MLQSDPQLAAAVQRHQRDMALLRMEIDRARTTAELEQIRAALTGLRAEQQGGQQGERACVRVCVSARVVCV